MAGLAPSLTGCKRLIILPFACFLRVLLSVIELFILRGFGYDHFVIRYRLEPLKDKT